MYVACTHIYTHYMSSQSKKRKYLKWFEEVFVHVSEDDQALQIEEFQNAIHTDRVSTTINFAFIYSVCQSFVFKFYDLICNIQCLQPGCLCFSKGTPIFQCFVCNFQ